MRRLSKPSKKITVSTGMLAEGVRDSSDETEAFEVWDAEKIDITADVSAIDTPASGIARIYFDIYTAGTQGTPGSSDWVLIGVLEATGSTNTERATLDDFARWVKVKYTIEGTFNPSEGITFDVQLTKHLRFS